MGDEWGREYRANDTTSQPGPDEMDKRIEDIKRVANEAQQRLKRVAGKANDYWQQAQVTPTPRQPISVEEQRIRQLANMWSNENWRLAKDLGTYMDIISWSIDEVWEMTIQTRWEIRAMETVNEPYTGKPIGRPQPLLPVWDYELPAITGLKAPQSRTRLEGLDEVVSCTVCNGTGRALCTNCNGRGWVVCPDCKGRTKKRCATCRGRGYVADWVQTDKKPFFQKQAENVANSLGERVADVFDGIRQQGVPIPNPVDTDPANKGKTVPCPDCVNGEVDCTCSNGKRVCATCQGAKMSFCANCNGTGKIVRQREIVRRFDLRTQTRVFGDSAIPQQQLSKAGGELVYNTEVDETFSVDAPPQNVPMDVWRTTVDLVKAEGEAKLSTSTQELSRPTLQVVELVRIPYTKVQYRYADQDYVFYIYDGEGREKFYADRYPARWDRIERLVRAISNDLLAPTQENTTPPKTANPGGYRVPIEVPPYSIVEEDEEDLPGTGKK
jgi:hypothetical protein